jgi:multidrug resistance protein, MATE family
VKNGIFTSFVTGVIDTKNGEKYSKIMKYFIPEFISALVLYSLVGLLDVYFISGLKSTATYATLGITNAFLHYMTKFFEGIQVGGLILVGKYNGAKDYKNAGKSLTDALWIAIIVGFVISGTMFFGAYWIYYFCGVPEDMIHLGVPYLRIVAVKIFFMALYLTFTGFMRGVKDTKTPMIIFSIGAIVFVPLDYILIYGKLGFSQMGFQGSAIASVVQYVLMFGLAFAAIFFSKKNKIYEINLFAPFQSISRIITLIKLSIPVIIDKCTIAFSYIWLSAMLAPMGKIGLAAFSIVKDFERVALLPAIALASVVTLIVSNDYGKRDWIGIKSNAKKIVLLGAFMVSVILIIIALFPHFFVQIFDKKGDFTDLAVAVIPVLSVLILFDVVQLILSGAMRGAYNVKTVMITRLVVIGVWFMPCSYFLSKINIESVAIKFILVYGSFYIGNLLMSIVYITRFRGESWKVLDNSSSPGK